MEQKKLDRINTLAKLSKERALTEQELEEQKLLREEYIIGYRNSLRSHLDSIVLVDKDGKREPLKERVKNNPEDKK